MQAGNFRGTDKSFAETLPLMLNYQRIWVIGSAPVSAAAAGCCSPGERELARSRSG